MNEQLSCLGPSQRSQVSLSFWTLSSVQLFLFVSLSFLFANYIATLILCGAVTLLY